jgi:uncharacterized protein (DUF885 family)
VEVAVATTEATAGVQDPALAALLHDHWEATMQRWPTWATQLGDHRYDDRLADTRPERWDEMRAGVHLWRERAEAIESDALSPTDRVTRDVFISIIQDAERNAVCFGEQWAVSPRSNAFNTFVQLGQDHPVQTVEDGQNLISRYSSIPEAIAGEVANLRLGIDAQRTPTQESTRRTVELISDALQQAEADWVILEPARTPHPTWTTEEQTTFQTTLTQVVHDKVWPAFTAYRDFLRDELLPTARPPEEAGILHLPNGTACYAAAISEHTSLTLDADTIHQTGLSALEDIHAEFGELGTRLWSVSDIPAIFERLRTDPELHFRTAEEIKTKAEESLERARLAMPDAFGVVPKAPCVVTPIPEHEAPYTTIAYYRPPTPDGKRPGQYFINLYAPETRPRHEAEALAFHEAIPGHHTQLSMALEQDDLPAFRRHFRSTGYTEGWALYTERLADEMGLYSSDVDRLGMLSFDAWRAARLVVDTGIHAKGWSRQTAIEFMQKNTPLALNNIENEIDRYISWPGQALAYKLGQIEMFRLRKEAQTAMGDQFDLKEWHDEVLRVGAVPLPVLRKHLTRWSAQ